MKKMFKYASLGAIALVGAVSFSACSSSDEIVDNPDYNPVDNTVKTQIAFSLSKGGANKALPDRHQKLFRTILQVVTQVSVV